ncbi:hypothetical protein RND81_05G044700 [Saponaria officinalis]|uniref:Interactor of constitutive active ROPs 2, chloroplastic n=1 Tax=Saponaria officinalis TaxID=3572 RepID=A0AAW1KUN8_SAPOF
MQTSKASNGSMEVPQRKSPSSQASQKSSSSTKQTSGQLKVGRFGYDSAASPKSSSRIPKNRSPKVLESGSPRSPMTEKQRISKVSNLESRLAQLEDELKRTKDQLSSSETQKRHALLESEEMKKKLAFMSARLEESQQQLDEFSTCEDSRIQELRKLSQERDRVWQSEVEAIQKQHSMDSAALASALNEIQKLKKQLEMASDSEATHSRHTKTAHAEIECLRVDLSETVSLVENLRKQINDCKRSEIQARHLAQETQMQLEEAMTIAESLRSAELKAKDAYNGLASELEKSNEKATLLEMLVMELEEKLRKSSNHEEIMPKPDEGGKKEEVSETIELNAELDALKLEVDVLKSSLEASELRYQEEYLKSTSEIRNAFDEVERTKSETGAREAELEAELNDARITIDELKSELMFKQTIGQNSSENSKEVEVSTVNSGLDIELKIMKEDLQDLRAILLEKETQIQSTKEENERLKSEREKTKEIREAAISAETTMEAAETEALLKLGYLTEEAGKSDQKAARVAKQLEAAQKENTELETELRKLKVQSDQWRKAAEAAAAMLSTESNNELLERTTSFDSSYNGIAAKMESPISDGIDDDSPKKKNGNMLKKFGVLWKKGQK